MDNMEKKSVSKSNPILWFIFVVVIPTIVATTLAIVILGVAGINVVEWAKEKASTVPVVSTWIEKQEEKEQKLEEEYEKAKTTIKKQEEEIIRLQQEISDLESTINKLNQDILKLEHQQDQRELKEEADQEVVDTVKQMSASFKEMKSKQAALIMEDLDEHIAIQILNELSHDARGSILEAMDPNKAARLTQLFINQ